MLEANFANVVNSDFTELSIQDTSTADYDNENINSRTIRVTDAFGDVETFPFPFVAGVGDIFSYPLTKDLALNVEMTLEPNEEVEDSVYTKTKNLLIPNRLRECLTEKRKTFLHLTHRICEHKDKLEEIELIDSCYDAGTKLIGTDLVGAQEALDMGNALCNTKECDTCQ